MNARTIAKAWRKGSPAEQIDPAYLEAATAWVAASRAAGLQNAHPSYDGESARALARLNMDADGRNGNRAMLEATKSFRGLPIGFTRESHTGLIHCDDRRAA